MTGLNVVLISTYELGRQPFGLASPAAWLRQAGANVTCLDLAVERLDEPAITAADLIAFHVPMHTATRLASTFVERVKRINPTAHLCFYGLYAPVNEAFLRELGADSILGGEFEQGLVSLVDRLAADPSLAPQVEPVISLARQPFRVPDRRGLPQLDRYAFLDEGNGLKRGRRLHRGHPWLQASLPPLPHRAGLWRPVLRGATRRGAGGHRATGRGRRPARHVRGPRFFQRPHSRHAHRAGTARAVFRSDVRRDDQDRAPAAAPGLFAGAAGHRMRYCHQCGRGRR